MINDLPTNPLYDREQKLRLRLNAFLNERLGLPERDYYADLDQETLLELKSVLSDINNIFTMKVCLGFAKWLGTSLGLSYSDRERIESSILCNPPNANGFDVEILHPIKVIAEVKCNAPINGGTKFGSNQRSGIIKDIESLVDGKKRSNMKPEECLKFFVLPDKPNIREATEQLMKNSGQHKDRIVFCSHDVRPENYEKIYVVHVNYEA